MTPGSRTGSVAKLVIVAIAAIALAVLAFMQTGGTVMQRANPMISTRLAPWDGSPRGNLSARLYTAAMTQAAQAGSMQVTGVDQLAAQAREAYEREPLSPGALAVIASSLSADRQAALWPEVAKVSRRDTLSQTLLLQFAATQRDVDEMINKLDQILLVRPSRGPAIYGLMSQAVRDPNSTPAFVNMLKSDPPWGEEFLQTAANDAEALDNLVTIRAALPDSTIDAETDTKLIFALARAGKFTPSYALYRKQRSTGDQVPAPWLATLPPFDWSLQTGLGFNASSQDGADPLEFEIGRGKGGAFAQRVYPATGSAIAIRGKYSLKTTARNAPLTASVTCGQSTTPLASSEFRDGIIALDAALPATGCEFVTVALSGRAWSDGEPINGQISEFQVSFR